MHVYMYMHIYTCKCAIHTCVQIRVIHVSRAHICQHVSHHSPFMGFFGVYWMKLNLPLKPIIVTSTEISLESSLKVSEQGLDEWPEFVKRVVTWLTFLYVQGTIIQM